MVHVYIPSTFQDPLQAIIPEIFLITSICIILLFGVHYTTTSKYNKAILVTPINTLSIVILVFTIFLLNQNPILSAILYNNLYIVDHFATLIKTIACIATIACILLSFEYLIKNQLYSFEYSIMLLLALIGVLFVSSANDLMSLYLAIELQSLALYVMAAYNKKTQLSTEAGLKYFVLGAVASGFLLIGCSLLYGFTGMTSFNDLVKLFADLQILEAPVPPTGVLVAILFITIAFLFKVAAVPFHMWAPDVYEGAPSPVTAFFAMVPKIAIFGVIIRFLLFTFYNLIEFWQNFLIIIAITTLIWATFGAIGQKKFKRFLAYSAISHTGFILIGISSGSPLGIQATLVYLIIYIIMSAGIFSILLSLTNTKTKNNLKYLTELHNLGYTNPLLALSLATVLFSMAGIPPLAGFISKLYIFISAIDSSMYLLSLIGVCASVVASIYYLRLIKIVYFEKAFKYTLFNLTDLNKALLIGSSSSFIVAFFFHPAPLLVLSHKSTMFFCI